MELIKTFIEHKIRDGLKIYQPGKRTSGICSRCDNPIIITGKNLAHCEYHWLKEKFKEKKKNCVGGHKYVPKSSMDGIEMKMTWAYFIVWCIHHQEYKSLTYPALTRKDLSKHFTWDNLMWAELSEARKSRKYREEPSFLTDKPPFSDSNKDDVIDRFDNLTT